MPRTEVPRIRGLGVKKGSVRRLIERNNDYDQRHRHNWDLPLEDKDGWSSHYSTKHKAFDERSNLGSPRRRSRMSSERKMEVVRDAFRHVCRNPTSKTHTLSEIQLEFGTANKDGTMSVSSAEFRACLPRLLHIVNVSDLHLTSEDEDYIIEELDLNRDGRISYAEFVNFIAFSEVYIRRIARSIQSELLKSYENKGSLRSLFDESLNFCVKNMLEVIGIHPLTMKDYL